MTVIGADRSGLVEMVAARVADHGGNWLESRMCRLGGQFAGILRVEVPCARRDDLVNALRTLEVDGLRVIIHAEPGGQASGARGDHSPPSNSWAMIVPASCAPSPRCSRATV